MAELPNDAPWDELRRLWHALAGQRRAVKDDARFRAIHDLSPMETGVIDVVAETQAFYHDIFGVDLSAAQVREILDGGPRTTLAAR